MKRLNMKIRLIGTGIPNDFFSVILPQGVSTGKMLLVCILKFIIDLLLVTYINHHDSKQYADNVGIISYLKIKIKIPFQ